MTARDEERFLARWSRLKREGGEPPEEPAATAEATEPTEPAADERAEEPPELPSIDELDQDSDYSVFMREGVPEDMRRLALRKLWTSDPVYANLDGLLEYGEDFSEPFGTSGVIATVYRVGQGMPDPVKEAIEELVVGREGEAPSTEPVAVAASGTEATGEEAQNPPAAEAGEAADEDEDEDAEKA